MDERVIINGEDLILGRLGSHVATKLLQGYNVEIVNAEKIILSGDYQHLLQAEKERFNIRTKTTPWKGPFHYRRPDMFVKRSIRGMLPWKKTRGKEAYHRLMVHLGVPHNLENEQLVTIEDANKKRLNRRFITIGDLCRNLGWNASMMEEENA